ncbi:MAG: DUF4178 domain-containing protein [Limisphaerales bacterium]
MNTANPTPIRVGMSGSFAGKAYTIIARVVMGMEDAGETYYWNEFYLSDGSDRIAMLVCEEVYGAQQWRLFTELTPAKPLTAREAGLKKVGDRVDIDGVSAEVTVVDESRVHFIEGKAPDWVSVGDVAQYFNAEAGGKMWVVSWSGDEVEYYRGMQLHPEMVAQALRLTPTSFRKVSGSSAMSSGGSGGGWNVGTLVTLLVLGLGGLFLFRSCSSGPRYTVTRGSFTRPPAPPVVQPQPAPPPPLTVGTSIVLDGQSYRVITHRVTGFTKVNAQWDTHHYQVTDDSGQTNLLAVRVQGRGTNWQLMRPLAATRPPAPVVAGAMRVGDKVTVDGFEGTVSELLMSREISRTGPPVAGLATNGLTYHYLATGSNGMLLASWNAKRITFHRGQTVAKLTP